VGTQTYREMTLPVPETVAKRLDRDAKRMHTSANEGATKILSESVGASPSEIEAEVMSTFREMAKLPLNVLKRKAMSRISDKEQERLSYLQSLNGEGALSATQQRELDALIDRVITNAEQAAAARWVLKNMGTLHNPTP
jgi:hypothetical protein